MQIYQERRRIRKFLYSRAVLFLLSGLALFLFVSLVRIGFLAYDASEAKKKTEAEYKALTEQKERLDKKIGDLGNSEALEKEAKERFSVTGPGEKVLIIIERGSSGLDLEAKPPSLWDKIKSFFR